MPGCADIVLFAGHNASINGKLYAAAAALPHAELSAERGAFFGSLLGTLNHIVAGDTIWLKRFSAHPAGLRSLQAMQEMALPAGLSEQFAADLPSLLVQRQRLDAIILAMADELTAGHLDAVLTYRNSRGQFSRYFGSLLLHFFNHQTHHRGQASTLLSQAGIDLGVTDLLEAIPLIDAPQD
ncbi:MAG TPA: DinB family protein [Burkholderiaceae bacterium]